MPTSKLGSALVVTVLALSACSGPTTTAKSEPEKTEAAAPPVAVTAKTAFWEMYKAARAWSTDVLPLTIEAKTIPDIKNEDGKAFMATLTKDSQKVITGTMGCRDDEYQGGGGNCEETRDQCGRGGGKTSLRR